MTDVILETRRFASDIIRYLIEGSCSAVDLREAESRLNGATEILDLLGHYEAVQVLSRIVVDLPLVHRFGYAGDREMRELRALLAQLKEEIERQESRST
jgi:hypothetical protein